MGHLAMGCNTVLVHARARRSPGPAPRPGAARTMDKNHLFCPDATHFQQDLLRKRASRASVRFGSELFSVMSSELGISRDSGRGECNAALSFRNADAVHPMGSLRMQTAEGWSHPRLFYVGTQIYHPIDCAHAGRERVIRPVLRTRHCAGGSSGNGQIPR